jgi:hypothetical protein
MHKEKEEKWQTKAFKELADLCTDSHNNEMLS